MTPVPDRIEKLLAQTAVTGIDFIYVYPGQRRIDVHFFVPPDSLDDKMTTAAGNTNPLNDPTKIRIYNPAGDVPDKPVTRLRWRVVDGKAVLRLRVATPGDFTLYKLLINDIRIDDYYNDVTFDFKANCPSDLDCKPPAHECPPESIVDFPVDYLARDFWSYRRALLEFASLRYPDWPDRLEADAGVMMAELFSALGDEMAFYQDRIGREAFLETATQRRSIRKHGHLVDYFMHDGLGSTTWLHITVVTNSAGPIPAGTGVKAISDDGSNIEFAVGKGLKEQMDGVVYNVAFARNVFFVHIWDEDDTCLAAGSTQVYVIDDLETTGILTFDDFPDDKPPGKWVLLQTTPTNLAQPARSHVVRLIEIKKDFDFVLRVDITRLTWEKEQALPYEFDMTVMKVHGNIIPATAGGNFMTHFVTRADLSSFTAGELTALYNANLSRDVHRAIERHGRNNSIACLFTLPGSEQQSLVYLGNNPHKAKPEIYLEEMKFTGAGLVKSNVIWGYQPSLIGVNTSAQDKRDFTLEDGEWRRVVKYQRPGWEFIHNDYASNNGTTIRFGDGEFGRLPKIKTVFRVHYRFGNGRRDNVSADTLTHMEPVPFLTLKVTNPLAVTNGIDPETADELRKLAPDAFRAVTYRAVKAEDYAEAAERLSWVQRAGACFRWTGSWLSAFVTPDPVGTVVLHEPKRLELVDHLNRFRQAGRAVHVLDPVYANLDIEIEVCAERSAFPGQLKERVMERLSGKSGFISKPGFFSEDNFTFGTSLQRSQLEAVIQSVPGVRAVESIRFRRRGWFEWRTFSEYEYMPEKNEIIRVENDRLHPDRGSLNIYIHGGS